jgi:hypothetical protein
MKAIHLLPLLLPFLLTSCLREDTFTVSREDRLAFSTDTLRFDTVFTALGSATRFLRIYNRHPESIRISSIRLAGNQQSKFNLNVDGVPGDTHEDVVIYPNDSIYIFAEVTIDPDDPLSESPFFVYDSILLETNGNRQSVVLEAWGQNANYIPNRWSKDSVVLYTCNGGEVVWDDPRPYVVYGIVAFDDCTLTLPAGTRVHVHGGLSRTRDAAGETVIYNSGRLLFLGSGKLQVLGTADNPVILEGDRLEPAFADVDGQWTGLIFSGGGKGHLLEHAVVRNALFGLYVDSASEVTLRNVRIHQTSGPGIFAYHARIRAENCLVHSTGSHSVQLVYGGNYRFDYCTLANFGTDAPALSMGNGICDDPLCAEAPPRINKLTARFTNCILYGSKRDELSLSDFTGNRGADPFSMDYRLAHCIVRVDDLLDPQNGFPDFYDYCDPCLTPGSGDALFMDTGSDDYRLDTLSFAEGKAMVLTGITQDLAGNPRDPVQPDIGCFEYQQP